MALPIGYSDSKPILKYDAKAAKWKADDKVLNGITMIVDMDNLQVGPMRFTQGAAPDFRTVRAVDLEKGTATLPPLPGDKDDKGKALYRSGFVAMVKLSDQIAGNGASVREWASNSGATCDGFNRLHDLWLAEKDQHPGKLPVVKMASTEVISGQFGDNYKPVLSIVGWVDRPAHLGGGMDRPANSAGGNGAADAEILPEVAATAFDDLEDAEWSKAADAADDIPASFS